MNKQVQKNCAKCKVQRERLTYILRKLVSQNHPRTGKLRKLCKVQSTFAASDCTPSRRNFARSNRNPMCVQSEADYRPLMTDVVQSLIPLVKQQTGSRVTSSPNFRHHIVTIKSSSIDSGSSGTSLNSNFSEQCLRTDPFGVRVLRDFCIQLSNFSEQEMH